MVGSERSLPVAAEQASDGVVHVSGGEGGRGEPQQPAPGEDVVAVEAPAVEMKVNEGDLTAVL